MSSPRRVSMLSLLGLAFLVGAVASLPWRLGGRGPVSQRRARTMSGAKQRWAAKILKTDEEWKEQLTPEEYP